MESLATRLSSSARDESRMAADTLEQIASLEPGIPRPLKVLSRTGLSSGSILSGLYLVTTLRSSLLRYLKNHNRQILIDIQCLRPGNEGEKDSLTMCLCPRELKRAFNFNTFHYEQYEIIVSNHWQLNLSHGMFVKLDQKKKSLLIYI